MPTAPATRSSAEASPSNITKQFQNLNKHFEDAVSKISAKFDQAAQHQSDKLDQAIIDMRESVDAKVSELRETVDSVVAENVDLKAEISSLKDTVSTTNADLDAIRSKVAALEKESLNTAFGIKGCNIVVYGIKEENNERPTNAVTDFLRETIELPNVDEIIFRDCFRMGKKHQTRSRPMKVQLVSMAHKRDIMDLYISKRAGLINNGVRMRDDLPLTVRLFRKAAYPYFENLMRAGYTPSFRREGVRVKKNSDGNNIFQFFGVIENFVQFCRDTGVDATTERD